MIDFFHERVKTAEMTKKVRGIAKIKGAPVVNSRPVRKISKIAVFKDKDKDAARILLEVASTPEERSQGLMGRADLAPICGMLFRGLSGGGHFWMKDCLIPLDVIFVNRDGNVTRTYSMPVDKEGTKRYNYDDNDAEAIEVPSGFCQRHGIGKGSKVTLLDIRRSGNG